ncbi:MAG: YidC/Oxa1 family membrane protein insertase [bacterium]
MINHIAGILMQILDALYRLTGSYGWAVILLAVLIKLILYYPTHQQFKSMKDMQAIQPKLKEIQALYKEEPKTLQAKQQEIFVKYKINPLSGCLPLIIQMPILWAIWKVIMDNKAIFEKAYFLWMRPEISSLSLFGHPLVLPMKEPMLIIAPNLAVMDIPLLLLYGFSMYLSQKLTVTDPTTAKAQSSMTLMMPVVFTIIMGMGKFPAAMILYWLVFNILSIAQQYFIMSQSSPVQRMIEEELKEIEEASKPSKKKGARKEK